RVEEDHLAALVGQDADQAVAGGLRFVGDDGHLLLEQEVHQGRLAGVRPAGERHGARPGHQLASSSPAACGILSTRTVWMRRSAAASTVKRRPKQSTVSPGCGTWPRALKIRPATVS